MADEKTAIGYAGDLTPQEAWDALKANPRAQLVDVRTAAEWSFVGQPDLGSLGRDVCLVEWQTFPTLALNAGFVSQASAAVSKAGADRDAPIFLICRSGGRSRAAAIAMTQAGFSHAYNVSGGFEGDLDTSRHRGTQNGWKAANLPWKQT